MEEAILITVRQVEQPEPADGSVPGACLMCRQLVWLSPSSLKELDRRENAGKIRILCSHCAQAEVSKWAADEETTVSELGTENEVKATMGQLHSVLSEYQRNERRG